MANRRTSSVATTDSVDKQFDHDPHNTYAFSSVLTSILPQTPKIDGNMFVDCLGYIHNSKQLALVHRIKEDKHASKKLFVHMELQHSDVVQDLPWTQLVFTVDPTPKLANFLVQSGIGHSLRPAMWPRLSGSLEFSKKPGRIVKLKSGATKSESHFSYESVLKCSNHDGFLTSKQIEKDLQRIAPDNMCFRSLTDIGIIRLRRVLRSIAWLYPDVGYCQGMGVVVSQLLLVLNEEETFWMMCTLLERVLPSAYYARDLFGVRVELMLIDELVKDHLPAIHKCLEDHDVSLQLVTISWLVTLFCNHLPAMSAFQLFDFVMFDGYAELLAFTLGYLDSKLEALRAATDSAQVFMTLQRCHLSPDDVFRLVVSSRSRFLSSVSDEALHNARQRLRVEVLRRDHAVLLPTNNAAVRAENLPILALQRRRPVNPSGSSAGASAKLKKALAGLFGARSYSGAGNDDRDSEDISDRNIRQTELLVDLRDAAFQLLKKVGRKHDAGLTFDPATLGRNGTIMESDDKKLLMESSGLNDAQQENIDSEGVVGDVDERFVKATVDFSANDDDEISFVKGDVLRLLATQHDYCWIGENVHGAVGWFPAKFVVDVDCNVARLHWQRLRRAAASLLSERDNIEEAGDNEEMTQYPLYDALGPNEHLDVDSVEEELIDLVRGRLASAIRAVMEYKLRPRVPSVWHLVTAVCDKLAKGDHRHLHARLELAAAFKLDDDHAVLNPLELLQRHRSEIDMSHRRASKKGLFSVSGGGAGSVEEDAMKLRSLIAAGLNERCLHVWIRLLATSSLTGGGGGAVNKHQQPVGSTAIADAYYEPGALLTTAASLELICAELKPLAYCAFSLARDYELDVECSQMTRHLKARARQAGELVSPLLQKIKGMQVSAANGAAGGGARNMHESVREILVKHSLFSWEL